MSVAVERLRPSEGVRAGLRSQLHRSAGPCSFVDGGHDHLVLHSLLARRAWLLVGADALGHVIDLQGELIFMRERQFARLFRLAATPRDAQLLTFISEGVLDLARSFRPHHPNISVLMCTVTGPTIGDDAGRETQGE